VQYIPGFVQDFSAAGSAVRRWFCWGSCTPFCMSAAAELAGWSYYARQYKPSVVPAYGSVHKTSQARRHRKLHDDNRRNLVTGTSLENSHWQRARSSGLPRAKHSAYQNQLATNAPSRAQQGHPDRDSDTQAASPADRGRLHPAWLAIADRSRTRSGSSEMMQLSQCYR
jgi:hypothetical protein